MGFDSFSGLGSFFKWGRRPDTHSAEEDANEDTHGVESKFVPTDEIPDSDGDDPESALLAKEARGENVFEKKDRHRHKQEEPDKPIEVVHEDDLDQAA